jgi:hypothetical protein
MADWLIGLIILIVTEFMMIPFLFPEFLDGGDL